MMLYQPLHLLLEVVAIMPHGKATGIVMTKTTMKDVILMEETAAETMSRQIIVKLVHVWILLV